MSLSKKLQTTSGLLARVKGEVKQVLALKISDVLTDPTQVRKYFEQSSLEGLARSLKNQGQIEPIVVNAKNGDGKYIIQKGERRYRAAVLAGMETIEAIVNDDSKLDSTLLSAQQLAENIQRENLTPIEIAEGLLKVKGEDKSNKDLADMLGKSQSWISQHLNVLKAPDCVNHLIKDFKVLDATTINELSKLYEENKDICEAYCSEILADEDAIASRLDVKKLRAGLVEANVPNEESSDKTPIVKINRGPIRFVTYKIKLPVAASERFKNIAKAIEESEDNVGEVDESSLMILISEGLEDVLNGDRTKIESLLRKLNPQF